MSILSRKTIKAAALAVTLGAVAIPALPAQAQSFTFEFGTGGFWGGHRDHRDHRRHFSCMTDHQVRQRVADYGYSHIYLNVARGDYIQVRATRGRWVYLIDFNRCTGRIEDADRLRRANGGGFGFQFGYGGNDAYNSRRANEDDEQAGDLH